MDPRIAIVLTLLQDDPAREIPVAVLAGSVNLSPSRLRHLFQRATGEPIARFRKRLRMERARELLESTTLSVKQVMARVGIEDQSHFVRDFKELHGLPPREYRRRVQRAGAGDPFGQQIASAAKKGPLSDGSGHR